MPRREIQTAVLPICQQQADEMHFELVDAELVKEGPGRYLRIYIDRPGGIPLDELEAYHRAVQPRLEKIEYDFLEVCSPGLDRPLKKDRDFARALGTKVEVKLYKAEKGSKLITGTLRAWDEQSVTIEDAQGAHTLNRKALAVIKPVIEIDLEDEGDSV